MRDAGEDVRKPFSHDVEHSYSGIDKNTRQIACFDRNAYISGMLDNRIELLLQ